MRRGPAREGDADQGGFAVRRGEGEDAVAQGEAEGPGCVGGECGEEGGGGGFEGGELAGLLKSSQLVNTLR